MPVKLTVGLCLFSAIPLFAQTAAPAPDVFQSLSFLEGSWDAKTGGNAAGAASMGTYAFKRELDGHVLARHTATANCKGPANFDCEHGDLLYIYPEGPGQQLKAIYFDSEGHVLHYVVSTPTPARAVFLSEAGAPGPQFQLIYELKSGVMSGKFQIQVPGQTTWTSYLEWSGPKK